jgi:hypothetical protein
MPPKSLAKATKHRAGCPFHPGFSSLANGVETRKLETGTNRMTKFNLAPTCFIDSLLILMLL